MTAFNINNSLQCATWKMSWLKLMFSMSWLAAVLNLAQSVLTYQTSVYVIGFLAMVKEGEKQQMTFRWNSIKSIRIRAMEKRNGFSEMHSLHEFSLHTQWHVHISSDMLKHVCTLQSHNSIYSFFSFQAFAIPGQYAFAHQDVSVFIWVADTRPNDLLLPTPSKPPLRPLCTLLCKDETSVTLICWHY